MDEIREIRQLSSDSGLNSEHVGTKQREFLALLLPVLPKLSRFCRAACREKNGPDGERAKDLASETVLKAFENFDRLREPNAFLSYLFTIAVRINRHERVRSAKWQPLVVADFAELEDPGNSPDARADVDHLYAALAKLPKKQREAIVMSEIAGLKLEEVASIQGSSLSAVKSRVSRGRMKLAELLGVNDEPAIMTASGFSPNAESTKGFYHARFAFSAKDKL